MPQITLVETLNGEPISLRQRPLEMEWYLSLLESVAKWLTPQTLDLEVCRVVSLRNFTQLCLSSPRCINGDRKHTAEKGGVGV